MSGSAMEGGRDGKTVVKQAAPDISNAGDDLQDLMNDLDTLIKEA